MPRMSAPLGSFVLVLHAHLPYVLRHSVWPHGEDWLYEAAVETYLPLLTMIDECVYHDAPPHLTINLSPILLEQLDHEHFKKGFEHYLADRVERAGMDRREFESQNEPHLAYLAERWQQWYESAAEQFANMHRDIPRAFAKRAREGWIEILTSAATHAYFPLLYEDSSIRAQLRAGLASSHRILGFKPTGLWLPECGYRPGGPWRPPIGWSGKDHRIGIEHLVADETLDHFFVEHHLIQKSRSEMVFNDGQWWKVDGSEGDKYSSRGWQSIHEAHWVNSNGTGEARIAAMGRDPEICEKVWSGAIGYPADPVYLEFHKRWGTERGLRYWKVTGTKINLGDKHHYDPDHVPGKLHEHAQHFSNCVRDRLRAHHQQTGRHGMVVATFDAELFGHWWFEGPQFLRDVILTINADPQIQLATTSKYLHDHRPDKIVSLPEGSWGEGGDHRVWTNEQVNWMLDIEYRCEANFGKATYQLPWESKPQINELLKKAGRELLLLQASDWPFAVRRGQAVDYGIKRFMLHVSRFETLIEIAEKIAKDSAYLGKLTNLEQHEIQDADIHDIVFPNMELQWWNM